MLRWARSWVIQKFICITASVNPGPLKLEKATTEVFSKKGVLENFAKLTEKDLCPSPTLVFYWQFYEIFEKTFFTEHFRATASHEEAWWSKILIPSSFLKKIFVEIIGVFNSELCWKKELCNSPCWPLGGMLHVNFQPGLNSTLPMVKALFVFTCWKFSPTVISILP